MVDPFGRALAADLVLAESGVDQRHLTGPFDIIGDVHGCIDELVTLLGRLGYGVEFSDDGGTRHVRTTAPAGRMAIFVGDLTDRGRNAPDVLRIVMAMVAAGQAKCVVGNHDDKFHRWLMGHPVKISHGLDQTVQQFAIEPPATVAAFRTEVAAFLDRLPIYLHLAAGDLVVAHAGIESAMIGRVSSAVRRFCIYGDTDGHRDANGLSVRYNWATRYDGPALVVYGHTPVAEPVALNGTLCIDTGCCFGGALTAYRWPERDILRVPAHYMYATRLRPFGLPPPR